MSGKCELFVLRDEEGPILYAPLRNLSARLNEAALCAVSRRINGRELSAEDRECLSILEQSGFFTPAPLPENVPRKPVQVTLFPSDGCNLRCRYCYAGAEKLRHRLSPEIGRAAIDYVAANAKEQGMKDFVVGFHGNGEPFHAFPVLQELCRYAYEVGERTGLQPKLTAATNGVLSDEQCDWLLAWFDGVNISFDGLAELQNTQRPMADGSGSFVYADKTLRRLNDSGKVFGIRSTVTAESVDRIPDIARFVLENYPRCDPLHVEPMWEAGRSLTTGVHTPLADRFIEKFLEAESILHGKMRLVFSAARSDFIDTSFCAVSRNSFVVTAEGNVTSCYEVCEYSDPRAERFIYGSYDPVSHSFVLDERKMEELHTLHVRNIPYCENCFCKYSCCGDCAAKLLGNRMPSDHAGSERCAITRALTLRQLSDKLRYTDIAAADVGNAPASASC